MPRLFTRSERGIRPLTSEAAGMIRQRNLWPRLHNRGPNSTILAKPLNVSHRHTFLECRPTLKVVSRHWVSTSGLHMLQSGGAGIGWMPGGLPVTQLDPDKLANELHDGVVQELSALLLQLETYQRKLETDPVAAKTDFQRIKTQARQTLKSLREVIAHLRHME